MTCVIVMLVYCWVQIISESKEMLNRKRDVVSLYLNPLKTKGLADELVWAEAKLEDYRAASMELH